MYKDGYKNITNIDYSATVIENMKKRCADMPEMKCKQGGNGVYALTWYLLMRVLHVGLEMDIRDLKFPDQSFDVVIDKGKRVDDRVYWLVG